MRSASRAGSRWIALAHVRAELSSVAERLTTAAAHLYVARSDLGALRDWVDELVTCATLGELLARLATRGEAEVEFEARARETADERARDLLLATAQELR